MISTDYTIQLGKLLAALGGMGGSTVLLIAEAAQSSSIIQYGAMGILGACAIYVVTKLVPMSIESRRLETAAFIETLTSEREKLVSSMEKLDKGHAREIEIINTAAHDERKAWAGLMNESNVLHAKSYGMLRELSVTLRAIKDNTDIEAKIDEIKSERDAK